MDFYPSLPVGGVKQLSDRVSNGHCGRLSRFCRCGNVYLGGAMPVSGCSGAETHAEDRT